MIEIKNLLSHFNNLLFSEQAKRESVRKVISEVIGTGVTPNDLKIKHNVIYLNLKPIYKNEVFLKQEQIFLKLKEIFGDRAPHELR